MDTRWPLKRIFMLSLSFFILNQIIDVALKYTLSDKYDNICRLDCSWYVKIINDGYYPIEYVYETDNQPNWPFFPLFPLFARGIQAASGLSTELAVIITAKIFFFLSIIVFLKFCLAYKPNIDLPVCAAILCFNPYSIYANAGYTEPMFLFMVCISFLALRHEKYILSGTIGGMLSSVRVIGVLFFFPYFISILKKLRKSETKYIDIALGAMLIPFGLAVFMIYLHFLTGDALTFSHVQKNWTREIQNPISVMIGSLYGSIGDYIFLLNVVIAFGLIGFLVLRRFYDLAVFSFLCTIVPLSTSMLSMPRYIWWQAPLLFAASQILYPRWLAIVALPAMLAGLVLMYYSWFTGKWFVI